ncbi:MAG TPA: AraC family ligand binding domain-containing protein [Candidatus Saccharimonadales bacterium]|nr:AraC family ligand binding domain-containing protein [Candidatus Saccharimonadales bacterium]
MTESRLRRRPADRFAGAEHAFELAAIAERLRNEPHPGKDGHRQITIFRDGPVSLVLFDFEQDGRLVDHLADGLVSIHVLGGRVAVRTGEANHDLAAGSLLVLVPGVVHNLHAVEPSRVLVSVVLEPKPDA